MLSASALTRFKYRSVRAILQSPRQKRAQGSGPILRDEATSQPWWLGFLDTGVSDVAFLSATRTMLYASWGYVLVEAGPEEAGTWRRDGWGEDLPDLMFPSDRAWLFSTLWDDDWSCVGGSRSLIDAFLSSHELKGMVREIDPSMSMDEVCPPGHEWF